VVAETNLRVVSGPLAGREIPLAGEVVLGRGEAGLGEDPEVSRRHARVSVSGEQIAIEDLGSANGTFVNGEPITAVTVLRAGDRVAMGSTVLELVAPAGEDRTQRDRPIARPDATAVAQRPAGPSERLRVVAGPLAGLEIALEDDFLIGREATGDGRLGGDEEVSRRHARITRQVDGTVTVEDLGSTNGTYLNGWRFPTPQRLSPGDRIALGGTVLELVGSEITVPRQPSIVGRVPGAEKLRDRPTGDLVLQCEGVRKSYSAEIHVLKGVDLEIGAGEIVGLLGSNGAGKTTFVSIVAGLRSADAGSVRIRGVDALKDPLAARTHLGIAPQDLGIYPTMSVRRNLQFAGELAGLKGKLLQERVEEIGHALSLDPLLDRVSDRMSGGQKRRLHTGMAMLHHPELLILDEPTVGADIRTRQEILDVVKRLADEGRSVCYSTHYMPEIQDLGASVAVLHEGQIIARGSIAELIAQHSSPAVELVFDGPAPAIDFNGAQTVREGSLLRVSTADPALAAATVLPRLGAHAARLRRVDVVQGSLDSVYLALTEHRYEDTPGALASASAAHPLPPPVTIPPDYYPDPLGEAARRFWDGQQWTDQTA
jgi:ABC-2 type transport system ATP-binding protein